MRSNRDAVFYNERVVAKTLRSDLFQEEPRLQDSIFSVLKCNNNDNMLIMMAIVYNKGPIQCMCILRLLVRVYVNWIQKCTAYYMGAMANWKHNDEINQSIHEITSYIIDKLQPALVSKTQKLKPKLISRYLSGVGNCHRS